MAVPPTPPQSPISTAVVPEPAPLHASWGCLQPLADLLHRVWSAVAHFFCCGSAPSSIETAPLSRLPTLPQRTESQSEKSEPNDPLLRKAAETPSLQPSASVDSLPGLVFKSPQPPLAQQIAAIRQREETKTTELPVGMHPDQPGYSDLCLLSAVAWLDRAFISGSVLNPEHTAEFGDGVEELLTQVNTGNATLKRSEDGSLGLGNILRTGRSKSVVAKTEEIVAEQKPECWRRLETTAEQLGQRGPFGAIATLRVTTQGQEVSKVVAIHVNGDTLSLFDPSWKCEGRFYIRADQYKLWSLLGAELLRRIPNADNETEYHLKVEFVAQQVARRQNLVQKLREQGKL